jgi:lipopolysaccharide/colanic/teichoic acid biosynthesis glycosyltransferase
MYKNGIKMFLDVFCAGVIFLLLFPVFFLITIFLYIVNKGKPFFLQERPGKNEKLFTIIKFKTMNDKRDQNGFLLPDDKRLTLIGRIIRSSSLDEIPQLLNVIKGDMSMVGPRPLLQEYLPLYNSFQRQRHNVKPGITGYAQVNGRNAIDWEKKFELDIWYVKNQSFWVDLKILFLTGKKVLFKENINTEGQATTTYFKGN